MARHQPRVSKARRAFLKTFFQSLANGCFGQFYLRHVCAIDCRDLPSALNFAFRVPPSLCRANRPRGDGLGEHQVGMSTAAVVALFDDLSTASLIAQDRSLRPGVSIQLSTEKFHDIPVNSEVIVRTRADKIGRILGFSSIELVDATVNHTVLARGQHIKYLPMGWLWDSVLGFGLLVSVFLWLFDWWYGRHIATDIDHLLADFDYDHNTQDNAGSSTRTECTLDAQSSSAGSTSKYKDLIDAQSVSSLSRSLAVQPLSSHDVTAYPELHDKSVSNQHLCHFYLIDVKPFMYNGIGSMHGGAVAVAVEEACFMSRRSLISKLDAASSMDIANINIRYLAAMKVLFVCLFVYDYAVINAINVSGRVDHQSGRRCGRWYSVAG
jgi:hypothetical protein